MVRGTVKVKGSIEDLYKVVEQISNLEELKTSKVKLEVLRLRQCNHAHHEIPMKTVH